MLNRMFKSCVVVMVAVFLAGCGATGPVVYNADLRGATFDAYHGALVEYYPDAKQAGIDTPEFRQKWRDAAVQADSITAYYHALAGMCAAAKDPHLVLRPNYELWEKHDGPLGATDLSVQQVHGRPVLWNRGHDMLRSFGAPIDAEDRAMDGWTVQRFNGSELIQEPLGTTLNLGPKKSKLVVTLRSPLDGEKWELHRRRGLEVTVEGRDRIRVGYKQRMIRSVARDQNRAIMGDWALEADTAEVYHGRFCSAWRLDDVGVFVWTAGETLPAKTPAYEELQTDLDAAADVLRLARCTLVDLRFMGGGKSSGFTVVMEYLLSNSVTMTSVKREFFGLVKQGQIISDNKSIIHGPTVILINEFTVSYGEWMASLLRRDLNATTVGARTRGAEYCIVEVAGPDGSELRFGGDPYERFDDVPAFQGVGITPDVVVATADADLFEHPIVDTLADTHERQWQVAIDVLKELCP